MSQSPTALDRLWLERTIKNSAIALIGWLLFYIAIPANAANRASPSPQPQPTISPRLSPLPAETSIPWTVSAKVTAPTTQLQPQFSQASGTSLQLAQSITAAADGTGTAVTQTDNRFEITGGTRAGSNLFHSFGQLNLQTGQVANIVSNPDITNVLGRIVGGNPSVINGLLQLTGSNANLFLINPAGMIFGPEAQVIVPAAFTATTANAIQIDNNWFNAIGSNDYANLVGTPTGFAFTTSEPGAVINAGRLTAPLGESITLLGGRVVNTGTIETSGGTITIAAVSGENQVRITQAGSLLSLELPIQEQGGLNPDAAALTAVDIPALLSGGTVSEKLGLAVEDGIVTLVSTDTPISTSTGTTIVAGTLNTAAATTAGTGGRIDVLGDRIALIQATVAASGTQGGGVIRIGGDYQGQGSISTAEQTYISAGTTMAADALVSGHGGQVIVWADAATRYLGTITARGGNETGNGGFVEVSGKQNLQFTGQVDIGTVTGVPGQLLLDPATVVIGGGTSNDDSLDDFTIGVDEGGNTATFQVSPGQLIEVLNNGDVTIAASESILLVSDLDQAADNSSTSTNDLSFTAPEINLFGDLILRGGDLTLTAEPATGGITIFGGSGVETNGGDITLTSSDIELQADINASGGNITFNGPVVISGSPERTVETGADLGGDITLTSTLNSQSGSSININLLAGDGNVSIAGATGEAELVQRLDISGNDITLSDFTGNFLAVDATGIINMGNVDIDNTGNIGTLMLAALGDINTGSINVDGEILLPFGFVNISTGGSFSAQVGSEPAGIAGQSVEISAADNITTGNIESARIAGGPEQFNTAVRLATTSGNIQVGYIRGGAGGIEVDAGGWFQALNSRPASISRSSVPPGELANYLNDLGNPEVSDPIFINDFLVSLESVDGPVTIRYGQSQNRETLFDTTFSSENIGLVIGILIEGDPSQTFVVGPNYDDAEPFSWTGVPTDPFIANSEPLEFPSEDFPNDTGGIVAGISSSQTDASLAGSLQSQLFGNLDPGDGTDGGIGGGDGGIGGGDAGIGGGTDGVADGDAGSGMGGLTGGNTDSGVEETVAATSEEVPPETQNLEAEATSDLCEEGSEDVLAVSNILTVDESLRTETPTSVGAQNIDLCNRQNSTEETTDTSNLETGGLPEATTGDLDGAKV